MILPKNVFIRKNGWVGGVCGGLADRTGLPVGVLRLALFLSFFFVLTIPAFIYFFAVWAFPNELQVQMGSRAQFLGVCHKWGPKLGLHESWLRFAVLVTAFFTAIVPVFVVYMIFFFIHVLSSEESNPTSASGVRDVN